MGGIVEAGADRLGGARDQRIGGADVEYSGIGQVAGNHGAVEHVQVLAGVGNTVSVAVRSVSDVTVSNVTVSNVTGVLALVGYPVVVLIGATHPGYTRVDYDRMTLLCERVDCWPCHLKQCLHVGADELKCMRLLSPETVLEACDALLVRCGSAP